MVPADLKILLADDHDVVRSGLRQSLSLSFPNAEFGEAGNASEILQSFKGRKWDLLILDINMPGRNGLDVLREIKSNYPGTQVIVFSMYPEDQFAIRCMKAGASAYLTKDVSLQEIALAIRIVLKGERYLTASLTELITNELINARDDRPVHEILSNREYQVFLMIASGLSPTAIARELSLSVKTISVYRSNILRKMKLMNNSEMTSYAFKHKLVD